MSDLMLIMQGLLKVLINLSPVIVIMAIPTAIVMYQDAKENN